MKDKIIEILLNSGGPFAYEYVEDWAEECADKIISVFEAALKSAISIESSKPKEG